MTDTLAFANAFLAAVDSGDVDAVRRHYRDDVKVRHNRDEVEQMYRTEKYGDRGLLVSALALV
jgi:ketosteroid isomerase-like protein